MASRRCCCSSRNVAQLLGSCKTLSSTLIFVGCVGFLAANLMFSVSMDMVDNSSTVSLLSSTSGIPFALQASEQQQPQTNNNNKNAPVIPSIQDTSDATSDATPSEKTTLQLQQQQVQQQQQKQQQQQEEVDQHQHQYQHQYQQKQQQEEVDQQRPNSRQTPKTVWLVSFPGPASTNLLKHVEQATNRTTGSIREKEGYDVRVSEPTSPFVQAHLPLPSSSLLTETFCAGHQRNKDAQSLLQDEFNHACRAGYHPRFEKAVWLLRSPFEIHVARMQQDIERRVRKGHISRKYAQKHYPLTYQGWHQWCVNVQKDGEPHREKVYKMNGFWARHLPCMMDWYRYIVWHNRAWKFLHDDQHPMEVHVLYYESFLARPHETIQELLFFLNETSTLDSGALLSPFAVRQQENTSLTASVLPMFDWSDYRRAEDWAQHLSLPPVWKALERYFGLDVEQQVTPAVF